MCHAVNGDTYGDLYPWQKICKDEASVLGRQRFTGSTSFTMKYQQMLRSWILISISPSCSPVAKPDCQGDCTSSANLAKSKRYLVVAVSKQLRHSFTTTARLRAAETQTADSRWGHWLHSDARCNAASLNVTHQTFSLKGLPNVICHSTHPN